MSNGPTLGVFFTIVRPEEKAILAAAGLRGVSAQPMDDGSITFGFDRPEGLPDVIVNRSVSHTRSVYASRCFEHYGVPTVNSADVIDLAGDKVRTSLRLAERGIPTPRTVVALSPEAAMKALDEIGYPAVLKPAVGSWGRLMAKVRDPEEAEQVLEHKAALTSPVHSIIYVQEYVEKPGRDVRVFVIGDRVVAGMYRRSPHWRTNAARGASTEAAPLNPELTALSLRAAAAVGGGVLAVDLMEGPQGLVVHEVNPTPEFKALAAATGVDVAGQIVEYAVGLGTR
ncbi:MAG: lysine biosynthesis protein LysX [Thermoplasmata archaeon]